MSALRAEDPSREPQGGYPRVPSADESAAMRDAAAVVERVARDEEAAASLRQGLLSEPLPALEPDDAVSAVLEPGEQLYGVRQGALLNPPATTEPSVLPGYGGTLYLTSRRLIHIGQVTFSIWLADVEDVSLAGDHLLLALARGEGVSLRVDMPRTLRVVISAARRNAERDAGS